MALFLAFAPHAAASEYTHTLQPGQRLYAGDILYSPSHAYRLVMQGDGNLVLYTGGTALWSSKTNGQDGASAVMQGDGNFVVYQSGKAIWNSGTDHHSGAILDMQDDGNLVIYWENTAIWSTGTNQPAAPQPPSPSPAPPAPTEYTHTLQPGQRLYAGDILYSPSHAYRLVMQGDGNLVLYTGGTALWSSKTNGHSGANAVMQGDGNFVVYQSGKAIWNSGTDHHSGAILDMQDDGNLVIYQSGKAIWSTGTNSSAPSHSAGHSGGPGYRLSPGTIIYSSNHRYRLVMQGDGNLVVYQGGKALWSTQTQGHKGAQAVMQGDGNLVVYWNGKAIWSSGTAHHSGSTLDMQDDGNLVIYWQGKAIWSSKGSGGSRASAIEAAAARWARGQVGSKAWEFKCLAFVYQAWGAAGVSRATLNAIAGYDPNGNTYPVDEWDYWASGHRPGGIWHPGFDPSPPSGAIIFYSNRLGREDSHATISVGGGDMISPGTAGVIGPVAVNYNSYASMLGWWMPK